MITSVPDMSHRKLSQKQKETNKRMRLAIFVARGIMENPRVKTAGTAKCWKCHPIKFSAPS